MAADPGPGRGTAGRTPGLPVVTESHLLEAVAAFAVVRGWLVHHDRPARTKDGWRTAMQGHQGFPDLVLVRGGRLIFVELKAEKGRVSSTQERWIAELRTTGSLVCVWRPSDWPEIERTLM